MNRQLFRALSTVSRRRGLTTMFTVVATVSALTGGVALGVSHSAGPASAQAGGALARADNANALSAARAGTTSLTGTILAVGPRVVRIRTLDGPVIIAVTTETTAYRRAGKPLARVELARGQRVVVLGRTQQNGNFLARSVAVRGVTKLPPPPTRVSAEIAPAGRGPISGLLDARR